MIKVKPFGKIIILARNNEPKRIFSKSQKFQFKDNLVQCKCKSFPFTHCRRSEIINVEGDSMIKHKVPAAPTSSGIYVDKLFKYNKKEALKYPFPLGNWRTCIYY